MDDRRDDWRSGIDKKIVDLTTSRRVSDEIIDDLDKNYAALDRLLRGDPEKETDGLISRLHHLETQVATLSAVIFVDSTGKKGLLHEVEVLSSKERTSGERWKFATAVVVAILSLVGLVVTNWPKVETLFQTSQPKKKVHRLKVITLESSNPDDPENR